MVLFTGFEEEKKALQAIRPFTPYWYAPEGIYKEIVDTITRKAFCAGWIVTKKEGEIVFKNMATREKIIIPYKPDQTGIDGLIHAIKKVEEQKGIQNCQQNCQSV